MTAHGRDVAGDLLRRELSLGGGSGGGGPSQQVYELTRRMMTQAIAALEAGDEPPECVPSGAADILYARRSSGSVTITTRDRSGTRSAEKWSWIDAGELGHWRVEAESDSPIVRLVAGDRDAVTSEIEAAWARALQ